MRTVSKYYEFLSKRFKKYKNMMTYYNDFSMTGTTEYGKKINK